MSLVCVCVSGVCVLVIRVRLYCVSLGISYLGDGVTMILALSFIVRLNSLCCVVVIMVKYIKCVTLTSVSVVGALYLCVCVHCVCVSCLVYNV